MRIAIATPVYYPMINGVARFSYNLAMGLARRGHEVMVITPSQTRKFHMEVESGAQVAYLKSMAIKVYPDQIHPVPEKKKMFYKDSMKASVFPAGEIRRVLDKFQPEILHVQGSDPIGVAAVKYARGRNVPVVTTEHNQPEVLTESLPLGFLKKPVNKVLSNYFVRRQKKSDYVTMPTELAVRKLFKGREIGVPVEAVSNGVDLSAFSQGETPDSIYNIYSIPKGVPIILYIGRLDPEKRVDVALRAFAKFLDKHKLDELSKTLFLVVGDGTDKNHLGDLSQKLGVSPNVKFLGRVTGEDLYNIYRLGDAFVTASEIETQGIVLIEAAASGLPLIAVNAGAVAEICRDGENGVLVEPGDAEGIATAMGEILSNENKRHEMAQKSAEIAKEHSLEKTLDKFEEIYQKVIKTYKSSKK